MSIRNYIKEADDALEVFDRTIGQIANDRLGFALLEMEGKLKGSLDIIFGMGTEAITYRGHMVYFDPGEISLTWGASNPDDAWSEDGEELTHPAELLPLCNALDDVYDILQNYRRGSPPYDIENFQCGKPPNDISTES